jgi:hypothetical protein
MAIEFCNCKLSLIQDRLMVQYVRAGIIYASEDHWIKKSSNSGLKWNNVCRLESGSRSMVGRIKDNILRAGLPRRIRRNIGIHNVVVLPSGTILIQYDGIYRYDGNGIFAQRVFGFRQDNIIGPLKNGFVVDDRTGNVYWGEYNIARPYSVRIFKGYNDGRKWKECYRFPLGRIRHVHSIIPDYYRDRLWICTGDSDNETALFYTDDDFQSVNLFGGGDQSWRMVSLLPCEDALYWGSDAGQDASSNVLNYIYKWDFQKNKRERLACIDKPAYYSTLLKDGTMVIGVHHEPKIERDVTESADLWSSTNGRTWEKVLSLPYKPSVRKNGTKYATICMPLGDNTTESLYFTPLNVRKNDFQLMKLYLNSRI